MFVTFFVGKIPSFSNEIEPTTLGSDATVLILFCRGNFLSFTERNLKIIASSSEVDKMKKQFVRKRLLFHEVGTSENILVSNNMNYSNKRRK